MDGVKIIFKNILSLFINYHRLNLAINIESTNNEDNLWSQKILDSKYKKCKESIKIIMLFKVKK